MPTNRSNITCTPQMSGLLHSDNVDGFLACLAGTDSLDRMMSGWMRNNVLHAIASCPKVLTFWKTQMEWDAEPGLGMVQFLGEALETSSDADKIRLLAGDKSSAVAQEWNRGMVNNELFFERLSPAWMGAEGSPLRAAMEGHGWTSASVSKMIRHGQTSNIQRWSAWVPFLETMLVHKHAEREHLMKQVGRFIDPCVRAVPAEAHPEDVALAQALCCALWPNGSHYEFELPPNFQPVPIAVRQDLDLIVQMHAQLDQLGPLMDSLATGRLPQDKTPDVFSPGQGF